MKSIYNFLNPSCIPSGVLDVGRLHCLHVSALKGGLLSVRASLNGCDELPAILDLVRPECCIMLVMLFFEWQCIWQ